jgi:hypothetical protein
MKKKIFLHLNGGLGNQMFQYAAARNLALINNAELIIDTDTSRIFETKRKILKFFNKEKKEPGEVYEGCELRIKKNNNIKFINFNLVFILYRVIKKIFNLNKNFYVNPFFVLFDETNVVVKKNFLDIKFKKRIYLLGFFQSEKYFELNKKIINNEILFYDVKSEKYKKIKDRITQKNSIILGVRYHKSTIYNLKYKNVNNNVNFYKNSFKKILYKIKNPKIYIFSTKMEYANYIIQKIPTLKKYRKIYITSDLGYLDAYKSFWLMTHGKNQIISSSTLYWWSAYIASNKYKKCNILCDNKFPKKQTILRDWKI